jgi:integrase
VVSGLSRLAFGLVAKTRSNVLFAVRLLVERLGDTKLDKVTSADAEALVHALESRYASNTVRRVTGYCRQIFAAAIKRGMLTCNPFADLPGTTRPNRSRSHYVSREEIQALIDAAPDAEWRLILGVVSLCRLTLSERSDGVAMGGRELWDGIGCVSNIKTRRKTGEAFRVVPLFPELRPYLEDAFALATPGQEFVITRWRKRHYSMWKTLRLIAHRAGVKWWPKPFVNMRASAATDLVQRFPHYVVTAWLGHTREIAESHYWQVTEEHYRHAAQKAAQQGAARSDKEMSSTPLPPPENAGNAALCHLTQLHAV